MRFIGLKMAVAIAIIAMSPVWAANVQTPAKQVYITDFETGKLLYEKDGETQMKPASMAKIMTVFIAFQRVADGSLRLDDEMTVSQKAWKKGGSRSFLEVGTKVTVKDLLHGIIIQSGNDAAIVLAEGLSGTEDAFADEMNRVAGSIGMSNTKFTNATGWPHPELTTTAKDLNILTTELLRRFPSDKFPELYPIFAKKEFTYNKIRQMNRNPLMYKSKGADGLKTGHTEESGYGLVGSAIRDDQRVVMVLNGMSSIRQRASESRRILDLMFREYKKYTFFEAGTAVDQANVWLGKAPRVDLVLDKPLTMVLSRDERRKINISVKWQDPVPAPIRAGDKIGTLTMTSGDMIQKLDLRAGQSVNALGVFERFSAAFKYLVFGAPSVSQLAQ
jgi:D-alanyl-D-alanine carboxypeptidase (penicillin-binding protein 5/6)